jgi:hypothetical protein
MLQIAATAAALLYLGYWRLTLQQRRTLSWEALHARLIPGWQASVPDEPAAGPGEGAAEPVHRSAKLLNLYRNARTMQEIADYALRNFEIPMPAIGHAPDRSLAEELHRDATCLRFRVLIELAQYALGRPAKAFA